MKYTNHALYRMNERLANVVTAWDISKQIFKNHIPFGRSYLIIKRIPYTEIRDESVKPDGIARGDLVIAVLDNTLDIQITTIILRKSTSKAAEYQYVNAKEFGL